MKKSLKNISRFIIAVIFLSSCSSKKKIADVMIPDNAAIVFHINAASLSSKLSWDDIKKSDWFKMANEEGPSDEFEKKLLDNPENSGIDLKSDFYVFMQMRGKKAYVVTQGKLKDAKAFETTMAKAGEGQTIKKDGTLNYLLKDEGCISWNTDRFIAAFISDNIQEMTNRFGGKTAGEITEDSIFNYTKSLYNLKSGNSIGNDSRFANLMGEKGDMHFWINTGSLIKSSIPGGISDLFKAASLLDGNVTGYTLNFDNGKITASSKSWYNKELSDFFKKYKPGNLNTDMLKRISGKDVVFVLAMNYPPEGLKEFLKLLGVDGMVNGELGKFGFSTDDFVKANKGDLLLAVSDFSVKEKTKTLGFGDNPMTYKTTEPDANVLFATSINDKAAFDKMADVLKSQALKQGGAEAVDKIKYTIKDNWFIAGNTQANVDAFAAGNKTDHDFISKISGHPLGGYVDLKKMLSSVNTKETENFKGIISGEGNIWDNIVFYGGDLKDGAREGYFEVNMIDKSTNSLKQLNNYLNTASKTVKDARKIEMKDEEVQMPTDSPKLFTPPVIHN